MDIEDIFDVEFSKKRPRGKSWTSEDNPQHARWKCLVCDMESSISGIIKHHKHSGHIGKQRVLL